MPPFVHTIRVRYNECDRQDAVFNANYLVYIDVTMTEWLREAFGAYDALLADGIDLVVAEANVKYRQPAKFDDELSVAATVTNLGTTSVMTRFDITRDGDEIAIGELRYVLVTLDGGKTPIPDKIRDGLQRYSGD